jgi:hypothetical protein
MRTSTAVHVTRVLAASGLFALLSASAFAECQVPDNQDIDVAELRDMTLGSREAIVRVRR